MEMKLDIPEYDSKNGLPSHWSPGFAITVAGVANEMHIKANKEGLISLAVQLLTLAQDDVPIGRHYHYDEHTCLEDGSMGLVVEKV